MNASFLFLAPGFEEVEALATVDILRRAGMDVKTVAVADGMEVTGAHGIRVIADVHIDKADLRDAEWLICPGGMPGATNLAANKKLCDALVAQNKAGRNVAAICASPAVVLAPLGILDGREATCYPGFESNCPNAIMSNKGVVSLSNLITASGPGFTTTFALAIVAHSMGLQVAQDVAAGMLIK